MQDILTRATIQRMAPGSFEWWVEKCEVSRDNGQTWRTSACYVRHSSHVACARNPVIMGTYLQGDKNHDRPTIH